MNEHEFDYIWSTNRGKPNSTKINLKAIEMARTPRCHRVPNDNYETLARRIRIRLADLPDLKIFEGDILKLTSVNQRHTPTPVIRVVRYDGQGAYRLYGSPSESHPIIGQILKTFTIEILGDEITTPQLLPEFLRA